MDKKADIITLDLQKLIDVNLTIEQFVFITLIDEKKPAIYESYSKTFKNIISSREELNDLIERGLIVMEDPTIYKFNNFKVTDLYHQLFSNNKALMIADIKATYPKQTPSGKRKGLQADSNKWIPKYLNIVKNNSELHSLILDCIRYEMQDRATNGQSEYIPLLTTYINNARWEVFMDDVIELRKKGKKISEVENNTVEDI